MTTATPLRDSRDLADLHPTLRPLAEALVAQAAARGIRTVISCTYRPAALQDRYYAQGRTTPGRRITNARGGESPHNVTLGGRPASAAFDIYPVTGTALAKADDPRWTTLAEIGRGLGLVWGGDFRSIRDCPHFELSNWRTL